MPLRPWFLFRYGQLLMLLKRRARALEVFRSVARLDPTHHQAWSCAAMLLAERGEYVQAIEAFERVCVLTPARAGPHFNVAFLLQRAGRHRVASPRFERALQADPGLERARRGLEISQTHLEKRQHWKA
jgi:tetratricopeptide (TPR) repeat protein